MKYSRLQASNILAATLDSQLEPEHSKAVQSDHDAFQIAVSYLVGHGTAGIDKAVRYIVVNAFKHNLIKA